MAFYIAVFGPFVGLDYDLCNNFRIY